MNGSYTEVQNSADVVSVNSVARLRAVRVDVFECEAITERENRVGVHLWDASRRGDTGASRLVRSGHRPACSIE